MNFFNLFKKKKKPTSHSDFSNYDSKEHISLNVKVSLEEKKHPNEDFELDYTDLMAKFLETDFLGKAAKARNLAKEAVKDKQYDKAWGLYNEQKILYMQHANRCSYTAKQALSLDGTVHEELANIMRLEGKHQDALVHIVYWVLTSSDSPIKRHQQKFQSYFNRCKFKNTTLAEAREVISSQSKLPDLRLAKSIVSEWID